MNTELYLNYDGVLLPYTNSTNSDMWESLSTLPTPIHAPTLAALLEPYPNVSIVLNTWWSFKYGSGVALDALPEQLRCRVVDDTFDNYLRERSRGSRIPDRTVLTIETIERRADVRWLVLDHNACRWPKHVLRHAILLHPSMGLGSPRALSHLRSVLAMPA